MMSKLKYQAPYGTQDVLPEDQPYWKWVTRKAEELSRRYGFQRIDTPLFEDTQIYIKGSGEASDFVVQKEMYTLEKDEGQSITFRPEFTPGIIRAYLEHGMSAGPQPVKLYSIGPIFRHDRPQAGRYRQHSQFNAEIVGDEDPVADLEVMLLAFNVYRDLGYQGLSFQLNSTGCPKCRPVYIEQLVDYLEPVQDRLAEVDKIRLSRNPLRVLDSKEPGMEGILERAPHIIDHLCDECRSHMTELRNYLDNMQKPYSINFRLVRGIDYYTKTVFEVWAEGIGAQAAVCGGGRYDGLAEMLGGPPTPGVGFGSGIERIILGLKAAGLTPPAMPELPIFVAYLGAGAKAKAVELVFELRDAGLGARIAFAWGKRSLKSQMREAGRLAAQFVIIVGESELQTGQVSIKDMDAGEQTLVDLVDLETWLKNHLKN
ncbi:MAG: histidine--tRNA ligase [Anaerolineales bacterium]|nr:histidine--tRNA ligase [Anaerolineales bacterium]